MLSNKESAQQEVKKEVPVTRPTGHPADNYGLPRGNTKKKLKNSYEEIGDSELDGLESFED